jgi:hypothetical protein
MKHRKSLAYFLIIAVVILVTVIVAGFASGRLTSEMAKHPSYLLWSKGFVKYRYTHLQCFTRDWTFRKQFVGKPIDALRPLFPNLHSGASYSPDSYRRRNVKGFLERVDGDTKEDYWLDDDQNADGYCVLVVDGKIRSFFFVKG